MDEQSPFSRFFSTFILVVVGLLLGVSTSAGMLILEPVRLSRSMPTEEEKLEAVYYVSGKRTGSKGAKWMFKKQAFVESRSGALSFVEEELNQWLLASYHSQKSRLELPAINMEARAELPVFRISEGTLQIGMPLEYMSFGKRWKIYAQVSGGFEETKDGFSFVPERFYIGSCPIPNAQGISRFLFNRYKKSFDVPEDIQKAWDNLIEVKIEEDTLTLITP